MFLLTSQTTDGICFWCVFVLMLGSFLIGYFGRNIKFPSKKTDSTKDSKGEKKKINNV